MNATAQRADPSTSMPGPDAASIAAERRAAEHRELHRIAAQRVIDSAEAGRCVDPHSLEWARGVVRTTAPLGRPLGTGGPAQ